MTILRAQGLTVSIGECQVCQQLNLTIRGGEIWAMIGNNGVGKTTLMHSLAGLSRAASGTLSINGQDFREIKRRKLAQLIGMLPQESEDVFPDTVIETTLAGRHPHLGPWQSESAEDFELARSALHRTDLSGMEDRAVSTLSGGERRRLALSTIMAQNPDVFLLDEPTNHLDLCHQIHILTDLCRYSKAHDKAILMVLHDINLAMRFCDKFLFLYGGGRTESGSRAQLMRPDKLERLLGHPVQAVSAAQGPVFVPG